MGMLENHKGCDRCCKQFPGCIGADCSTDAEQRGASLEHIKEGVCLCTSAELSALRISLTQTHQLLLVLGGLKTASCKMLAADADGQPSSQV